MADKIIPLSIPTLRGNEWKYAKECLDTNWVSYLGPFVDRFESLLATRCGAKHAIATVSGTAALHVALLLAGVEPDTEVVMPGVTFVAPANAVRYCGAWPTFVDLKPEDWQLDTEKLADFLSKECDQRREGVFNRATGRRISALLPVHLLGGMADVDAVAEIAVRYRLPIVEDAAECMGATYKGRGIGALPPGVDPASRLAITSFNGNKVITTGGGGAIFTDHPELAAAAKHLITTAKADKLRFYHDVVGFNYRMTNMAGAMGIAQLEQLDGFLAVKHAHAARYSAALGNDRRITVHPQGKLTSPTFWLYTIMVDRPSSDVILRLNDAGIMARPIWEPLYRLPMFSGRCSSYRCEFSEEFAARAVCLPSSVCLTDEEIDTVIAAVRGFL